MAARSETKLCGCLLAGIEGSNPAEGIDVSLYCEHFVLSDIGLC